MAATRLPGKPLLKIGGTTVISRVYKKVVETNIGQVVVATEDQEIFDEIVREGGKSILTNKNHKTGTDRIFEAYEKIKSTGVEYILNVQGDEPMIEKNDIINLNNQITKFDSDMGTLACNINEESQYIDENIVKVETKEDLATGSTYGDDNIYGGTFGLGYTHDTDGGFVRVEVGVSQYEEVSLTSTSNDQNKVEADIQGGFARISIGKSF